MVESKHWSSRLFVVFNYCFIGLLALSCLYRVPMEELIVYEETEMVSFNLR